MKKKTPQDLKRELSRLRNDLFNLAYYIDNIVPSPQYPVSAKYLQSAKAVVSNIDYQMRTKFRDIENDWDAEIKETNHIAFVDRLATINDPTEAMKRQGKELVETKRNPTKFIKNSIVKKEPNVKIIPRNITRTGSQNNNE